MISTHKDSLAALFKLVNFSLNIDDGTIAEQFSGLRCCTRVGVLSVQIPLGTWSGSETRPC